MNKDTIEIVSLRLENIYYVKNNHAVYGGMHLFFTEREKISDILDAMVNWSQDKKGKIYKHVFRGIFENINEERKRADVAYYLDIYWQ